MQYGSTRLGGSLPSPRPEPERTPGPHSVDEVLAAPYQAIRAGPMPPPPLHATVEADWRRRRAPAPRLAPHQPSRQQISQPGSGLAPMVRRSDYWEQPPRPLTTRDSGYSELLQGSYSADIPEDDSADLSPSACSPCAELQLASRSGLPEPSAVRDMISSRARVKPSRVRRQPVVTDVDREETWQRLSGSDSSDGRDGFSEVSDRVVLPLTGTSAPERLNCPRTDGE